MGVHCNGELVDPSVEVAIGSQDDVFGDVLQHARAIESDRPGIRARVLVTAAASPDQKNGSTE